MDEVTPETDFTLFILAVVLLHNAFVSETDGFIFAALDSAANGCIIISARCIALARWLLLGRDSLCEPNNENHCVGIKK